MGITHEEKVIRTELPQVSSVYGPVKSWRVGYSLGIDLLCVNSICSFNCTYCQLGFIQVHVNQRRLFVPTEKVIEDLRASAWEKADIVTFSGSGEPTLALNLGEAVRNVKVYTGRPVLVLTNGTLLYDPGVRQELCKADQVFLKLDAAREETFQRVNRPVAGVTLADIVKNAESFRREYSGKLGVQMMFVYSNRDEVPDFARILKQIRPDEVQVNSPTRPYPNGWYLASRGSHEGVDYPAKPLKQLPREVILEIVRELRRLTGNRKITSLYDQP